METRLWHPFANMAQVRERELVLDRAEDVWVWDDQGTRYLDASASLWYANIGHGRPEIRDAVSAQLARLEAYATYGDMSNRPAHDLAARLAELAPLNDPRVYFGLGGADAIDTAAKLARLYWSASGQPERVHLISRTRAYHGSHGIGTSIGGIAANAAGFGSLVDDDVDGRVELGGRAGGRDRSRRPGARRRLLRRAGDRRGRRLPAAVRLHSGGRGGVCPPRRPARRRLGHLRLRAARQLVRDRALGRRAPT